MGGGRGVRGGRGFNQAAFSLLANYAYKASANFTVHTFHTCCVYSIMCQSVYLNRSEKGQSSLWCSAAAAAS